MANKLDLGQFTLHLLKVAKTGALEPWSHFLRKVVAEAAFRITANNAQ